MSSFPQSPVGVTLTGEEWTTILIAITRGEEDLSLPGSDVYGRAIEKLAAQVCDASDRYTTGATPGLRVVRPSQRLNALE